MEESENLYKLYGYGLCKGKPTPKIAGYKVEYLHFRHLKFLVILRYKYIPYVYVWYW